MLTTNCSARALALSFRRICSLTVAVLCQLGLLVIPSALKAQSPTVSVVYSFPPVNGSPVYPSGLIQAGDGNFYGTTQGAASAGGGDGTVFQLTPSGTQTSLYSFTGFSDGASPGSGVIQGGDGNLYGMTSGQGAASATQYGTVFKLPLGATTLDTLYTFTDAADGGQPVTGLVLGSDGNYYGTTQGVPNATTSSPAQSTIFRMTPDGTLTTLVSIPNGASFSPSGPPVEFTDGNFYGTITSNSTYSGVGGTWGYFYQLTPSGKYTVLYTFTGAGGAFSPIGTPVVGSDGNFYGVTDLAPSPSGSGFVYGSIYRMTPSGVLTILHVFAKTDGTGPHGLFMGSDGNLYGATATQGADSAGTLFESTTSGAFTLLYTLGSSPTDPKFPNSPLVQGSDGNFYGATADVTQIFKLTPATALPAPVQITPSAATIPLGQPLTLSWQVLNAFSNTMRNCFASVTSQSSATGPGAWTGLQTGAYNATTLIYSGSATITPTAEGIYTYGLTCGGIESGTATVQVGNALPVKVNTGSLPDAIVGVAYANGALAATGGVQPYTWSVTAGTLPAGLTLNASTGVISGTPTTAETVAFMVQVKDSGSTPATATANLEIAVLQPLVIETTSLPAAPEESPYSQTLTATGGIPPYTWVQAGSGSSLPLGLTLSSAGVISGTVQNAADTKLGPNAFRVTVSDSAPPAARQTVLSNFTIVVTEPFSALTGVVSLKPAAISVGQTTAVTLNLSAPAGSPAATGSIQFQSNGVNFGSPVPLSNGSASLASPAFNTTGSYAITATYSGDPSYLGVTFPPATLVVSTAPVMFIQAASSALSAASGGTASTSITVYNANGAAVNFACSGLPANASCTFGQLSSSGAAALTITTSTPTASLSRPELRGRPTTANLAWLLPGVLALGAFARKRRRIFLLSIAAMLLVTTTALTGCGGGGSHPPLDSPPGTSSVVVTATAGSLTASTTITLTVQ